MLTFEENIVFRENRGFGKLRNMNEHIWMMFEVFRDAGPDKRNCEEGLEDEMGGMDECIESIKKFIDFRKIIDMNRTEEEKTLEDDDYRKAKSAIFMYCTKSVVGCVDSAIRWLEHCCGWIDYYHNDHDDDYEYERIQDIPSKENCEREKNVFKKRIEVLIDLREKLC